MAVRKEVWLKIPKKEFFKWLKNKETVPEFAKRIKVSPESIYYQIKKRNLKLSQIKIERAKKAKEKSLRKCANSRSKIKKADLLKYTKMGLTQTQIAKELNVKQSSVGKFLIKHNIKIISNQWINHNNENSKRIMDKWLNNNESIIELCKRVGTSKEVVYNYFKSKNIKLSERKKKIHSNHQKKTIRNTFYKKGIIKLTDNIITRWLKTDETPYELAKRIGIKPSVVYEHIKRNNIEIPKNKSERMITERSRIFKELIKNPDYFRRMIINPGQLPNKKEIELNKMLQKHFSKEWKYVGDGQVIIGGKCPDFININGKKRIIELFGEPWHEECEIEMKQKHYSKYGYDTKIIWCNDLSNKFVINMINNWR